MNFYFCETCGKRITDADLEQGQGRNKKLKGVYCKQCAVGVLTMDLPAITEAQLSDSPAATPAATRKSGATTPPKPTPRVPTSRVASARRDSSELPVPKQNNGSTMLFGGIAAAVLIVLIGAWALSGSSDHSVAKTQNPAKPTAVAPVSAPEAKTPEDKKPVEPVAPVVVHADQPKEVARPEVATEKPAVPQSFLTGGEDIREELARGKLDEIAALEKSGGATPQQLYAKYNELASSSFRTTKAGQEAVEKLKTLPAPAVPPPVAVAAPAPAVAPATPATSAAKPVVTETKSTSVGKGVWWEAEDAIENDFIAHIWLGEQNLDRSKISGGKYLNHLNDPVWLKTKGKAMAKSLFARYVVDVPEDGTYTLWVREYDPYSAGPWKFKWDEGAFFDVPPGQAYQDKCEYGKDRWLVWRSYPNQKLTKGKHTFRLEVNMEKHGVSGFDCFYLTTGTFKPDGPKKP